MQELKVEDNISKTQKGALRASSRKTVQQQPQQTFKDSFKNKCTNFVYKLNAFQVPNIFRKNTQHSMISLFGQQYSNEQDAKRALQQTVWFTYRSRFKVSQDLNSDSGWGCLLRVGQMILATALKKYFACRLNYSINQDSIENIIYAFQMIMALSKNTLFFL